MPFVEWIKQNNATWHFQTIKEKKLCDGNFSYNDDSIKAFALPLNFLMGGGLNCALGTTSFLDSNLL